MRISRSFSSQSEKEAHSWAKEFRRSCPVWRNVWNSLKRRGNLNFDSNFDGIMKQVEVFFYNLFSKCRIKHQKIRTSSKLACLGFSHVKTLKVPTYIILFFIEKLSIHYILFNFYYKPWLFKYTFWISQMLLAKIIS